MNYIKWIRDRVGTDLIFLNFAGAVIENKNGEILLQKRGDKQVWGFPGGAMELGESAEETVLREMKEETGLDVKVSELIGVYTKYHDEYPSGDKAQPVLLFFKCSILGGQLSVDHHETLELNFFKPDKVPPLVNKQHEDCLVDYISGKRGVFR